MATDAATELVFEPETSQALQFGFRCGFLGLFHMEIVQERLEREYGLDLIITAPSVAYRVLTRAGEVLEVASPADLPDEGEIQEIREPWMRIQGFTPAEYIGPVMEVVTRRRGEYETTEYLTLVALQPTAAWRWGRSPWRQCSSDRWPAP